MRFKAILFFLVVGGLVAFLILRDNSGGPIRIGQIAPDFTVKDSNGKLVKFSDYRGKFVVLNFWASDCVPCVDEMPDLQTMANTYKDRKFEMMPISVDINLNEVKKFYEKHNLTMPWYSDPGRQVYNKFHVTGTPETFLIDRNGHVLKHYWSVNVQIMPQIESYLRDQEMAEQASAQ